MYNPNRVSFYGDFNKNVLTGHRQGSVFREATARSFSFTGNFVFLLYVMEGLLAGLSSRFLLHGLVEAVSVDFLFVPDVCFYDREESIIILRPIEADNLLYFCAFAQTSGDEVPFHFLIGTSYLNSFFIEPLDVVLERLTLSLNNGFKGRHCFGMGP